MVKGLNHALKMMQIAEIMTEDAYKMSLSNFRISLPR